MLNWKGHIVYIALIIISAAIGAFISNRYSSSAIAELRSEIESERKISRDNIIEYQNQIDTLNTIIGSSEKTREAYQKELLSIRENRRFLNINNNTPVNIIHSADSLTEELRKIYN